MWSARRRITPVAALAPAAAGGGSFSTYVQTDAPAAQPNPASTTVTFTSVNIGTAASNRVVVLCFNSDINIASSVTVGGVSMTKALEESTIMSSLQIWYGTVPTGTTANVVLSFPGNPTNCILVAGAFNSGASATPGSTNSGGNNGGSNTQALTVTIPTSGFAVMAVAQEAALASINWTNTTAVGGDTSQNSNQAVNNSLYTAHSVTVGSPTSLTLVLGGSAKIHGVTASWGP